MKISTDSSTVIIEKTTKFSILTFDGDNGIRVVILHSRFSNQAIIPYSVAINNLNVSKCPSESNQHLNIHFFALIEALESIPPFTEEDVIITEIIHVSDKGYIFTFDTDNNSEWFNVDQPPTTKKTDGNLYVEKSESVLIVDQTEEFFIGYYRKDLESCAAGWRRRDGNILETEGPYRIRYWKPLIRDYPSLND